MTRTIMTQWLQQKGVHTHEASDWNELTLSLQELFKPGTHTQNSQMQYPETQDSNVGATITSVFIIIIDVGLLDLSTELWKQQLNFLDEYCSGRANFAWILNHETSNVIKAELRERGHLLMVNRPLYKAKVIQIFEAVINRDRKLNLQTSNADGQFDEFLEIDVLQSGSVSSDDSEKTENESNTRVRRYPDKDVHKKSKVVNEHKPLDGLCILLAEDTPVLQRVATIMLEKMGAKVIVVGDGVQAVDALKDKIQSNECRDEYLLEDGRLQDTHIESLPYDLILMDCQVSSHIITCYIPNSRKKE